MHRDSLCLPPDSRPTPRSSEQVHPINAKYLPLIYYSFITRCHPAIDGGWVLVRWKITAGLLDNRLKWWGMLGTLQRGIRCVLLGPQTLDNIRKVDLSPYILSFLDCARGTYTDEIKNLTLPQFLPLTGTASDY